MTLPMRAALVLLGALAHEPAVLAEERVLSVMASAYNSVAAQTDRLPNQGAWGDRIEPGMKVVAVSRDLLRAGLKRGTKIRIDGLEGEWTVLDRTLDNEPAARVLLDGVLSLGIRFMQDNGEWTDRWPPENMAGPLGWRQRPRAVEFVLETEQEGLITRLVEVAP